MTRRLVRIAHCHRCFHTWRMRNRLPRLCPRCKSRLWNVPKIRPLSTGTGLGIKEVIAPHRSEILRLARRYGARNLRVFGSVRRSEASETSDLDLLVDWERDRSLLDSAAFRVALRKLLGRPVDTVDADYLHWAIRPQVLFEAIPL